MNNRKSWSGVASIARFNWPYYATALGVTLSAAITITAVDHIWIKLAALCALLGSGYFLLVSLGVSYLVYDCSDLYRWHWLAKLQVPKSMDAAICCYTGFDDCSESLREKLQPQSWFVLDHYDTKTMTEASIQRARHLHPPAPHAISCNFDHWPSHVPRAQIIIGMLAIHELRNAQQRIDWFMQAKQKLTPDGSIVIIEHTRNLANFIAFGPGFLHFHSRATWQHSWTSAGLSCCKEFSITPWIRVFQLIPL
jgi:hypothetical protein